MTVSLPSPRVSQIMEAARVAFLINVLPPLAYDPALPLIVQGACLESFFVHVRAMIEFLEVKPTGRKSDYSASTLVADWSPSTDPRNQRLVEYWETASQHLMHFSRKRVKQESGIWESPDVEPANLAAMADDVLAVWDEFATVLTNPFAPVRKYLNVLFEAAFAAADEQGN